jgi:hypothetical protein
MLPAKRQPAPQKFGDSLRVRFKHRGHRGTREIAINSCYLSSRIAAEPLGGTERNHRAAQQWTETKRDTYSYLSVLSTAPTTSTFRQVLRSAWRAPQVTLGHASGGGFHPPHSLSNTSTTASTCSSSQGRPTICTPIGKPSEERPTGTTAAGFPSRLKNSV